MSNKLNDTDLKNDQNVVEDLTKQSEPDKNNVDSEQPDSLELNSEDTIGIIATKTGAQLKDQMPDFGSNNDKNNESQLFLMEKHRVLLGCRNCLKGIKTRKELRPGVPLSNVLLYLIEYNLNDLACGLIWMDIRDNVDSLISIKWPNEENNLPNISENYFKFFSLGHSETRVFRHLVYHGIKLGIQNEMFKEVIKFIAITSEIYGAFDSSSEYYELLGDIKNSDRTEKLNEKFPYEGRVTEYMLSNTESSKIKLREAVKRLVEATTELKVDRYKVLSDAIQAIDQELEKVNLELEKLGNK